MKNTKFLIIGHICIDQNVSEKISYVGAGGPAIFINKILNKFKNCKTTIISPYGKDFLPYFKNGAIYPLQPSNKNTLIYKNLSKKGVRVQKALNRKNAAPVKITKDMRAIIKQADIIFITPLLPNFSPKYIKQIAKASKKKAIKILLPQGYFRNFNLKNEVVFRKFSEANKVLPFIDFFILSNEDYPKIEQLSSNWAGKHKIVSIITLEGKGALIIDKNKKIIVSTISIPKNKIIDSVGCGDTFSAGFAYYYAKTKSLEKAVAFANKLAGKKLISRR